MTRYHKLRKECGMSQIRVQMETGIDQSNYSKLERGLKDPTYHECRKLAVLFGTSMDYLAGLTDDPEPYPRSKPKPV